MSSFSPALRAGLLAAALLGAVIAFGAGGCANSSTTPAPTSSATPSIAPSGSPTPSPSPTVAPQNFVVLHYAGASPTADPTYGTIDGYSPASAAPSPGMSPLPPQVIHVTANQTIQFFNIDSSRHTASNLGTANGTNWPSTFVNNNGPIASVAGTNISDRQFSTGDIFANGASLVYKTGVAGMYYFGDYYCYLATQCLPPPMRTVIIVQ